jgi:AcrR family transcriptional regulator
MQNAILPSDHGGDQGDGSAPEAGDVADRVARQALAKRRAAYASEVRRLLDAGLEVMRRNGTTSRPRVADIVSAAGLSNDAFYRHFPSKDALVAALLEDGTARLTSYLTHQMDKEAEPADRVRRFVEGVLSQADEDIAATTLAVLWNGGSLGPEPQSGSGSGSGSVRTGAGAALAALLLEPFTALGSADPELDASLAAHATLGRLMDHLWQRDQPTRAEIDRIARFWIAAVTAPGAG